MMRTGDPPSAAGFGPDSRAKARAIASEWDVGGAAFQRISRRYYALPVQRLSPRSTRWETSHLDRRPRRGVACGDEG